jgi:trk system potassium uptake protein TrkH
MTPPRVFIFSFFTLILFGAVLLWLPFSAGNARLSFIDALFSSASAVCVTGLAVIDIGKDLSFSGQVVTLLLFQIGGLGIITFSVVVFGLLGRGVSFRGRELMQGTFLHTPRRDFIVVIRNVLRLTFLVEGVGTVLLFIRFLFDFPVGAAFFHALYNAVSAFNSCGYSLFSDSLTSYRDDWLVNLTVMALIVLGGIGFIVQHEMILFFHGKQKRLSLHTKIVLLTSAFLIVAGALFFYLFEDDNILKDVSIPASFLASLFQSITARTAGFNTVDIGNLTNETIMLMTILMFIGASPGSTGGGIKTTSFTLMMILIWNRMRGRFNVSVFNRMIPREIMGRTISIVFAAFLLVGIVTSILLFFGGGNALPPSATRHFFIEYLFETVSAFGTVGLSMGITPKMNELQKIAIIVMMFAGRVGPLTLAFSWYTEGKKEIEYAEESVMVG